ncbi:hypothetical protein JW933_02475 [candidate division FCPU426 bacterium]|nr:hypothetical protein [candidate division FCPU426 bacterium]
MVKFRFYLIWAAWLASAFLAGCGSHPPSEGSENILPPEKIIMDNIQKTDISMILRVKNVIIVKAPSNVDMYGSWKIEAETKRCFIGSQQPGDRFTFYWMFEKGTPSPRINCEYIGSFKTNAAGNFYVPDSGYVFPYSKNLVNYYEKASE